MYSTTCIYIYIYIYIERERERLSPLRSADLGARAGSRCELGVDYYGQFSEFHVCFCGLDSGNLKFETVRTSKQHICF